MFFGTGPNQPLVRFAKVIVHETRRPLCSASLRNQFLDVPGIVRTFLFEPVDDGDVPSEPHSPADSAENSAGVSG